MLAVPAGKPNRRRRFAQPRAGLLVVSPRAIPAPVPEIRFDRVDVPQGGIGALLSLSPDDDIRETFRNRFSSMDYRYRAGA